MKHLLSTPIFLSLGLFSFFSLSTAVATDRSNSYYHDREIKGKVSNVFPDSFVVANRVITVTDNTLIDDSLIENARGVEISNDMPLRSVSENLQQLLPVGLNVEVQLSSSNKLVAISIEDD